MNRDSAVQAISATSDPAEQKNCLTLSEEHVADVLWLAEKCNVSALKEMCEQALFRCMLGRLCVVLMLPYCLQVDKTLA
ncbi:hypothetical protein KIN20_011923 [Parelaphostrongylus tenuis]|uniref:BTB domain-containing protein n=1 Tax=Parelaphostrongylus tenuis TaxID=148309 RepID=A0AAD5MA54_PARTN|nr:hypothetical protein KIN20_011923 [Parelaphostrongylus tenuis]